MMTELGSVWLCLQCGWRTRDREEAHWHRRLMWHIVEWMPEPQEPARVEEVGPGLVVRRMTKRTVRIDRAVPRRVLAPLRWRSFKSAPDRAIWEACWQPVVRLLDEGWRMVRVTIDWGQALPLTAGGREQAVRDLTGCYDGCEVESVASGHGRGTTTVELVRD